MGQNIDRAESCYAIKPSSHQAIKPSKQKAARGSAGAPCPTRHEPPACSKKRQMKGDRSQPRDLRHLHQFQSIPNPAIQHPHEPGCKIQRLYRAVLLSVLARRATVVAATPAGARRRCVRAIALTRGRRTCFATRAQQHGRTNNKPRY